MLLKGPVVKRSAAAFGRSAVPADFAHKKGEEKKKTTETVEPHKSSLGLDANMMALLCYLATLILSFIPFIKYIAWAAPLVIFFLEKNSSFVKFHALQAFMINIINAVLGFILYLIMMASISSMVYGLYYRAGYGAGYIFASTLSWIIFAVIGIFGIVAMIKAYKYAEYKIPVIGNLAMKFRTMGGGTGA